MHFRSSFRASLLAAAAFVVCLSTGIGCFENGAPQDDSPICPEANADQIDSFFKPRHKFPVHVIIDSDFSDGEKDKITDALATWNAQSQREGGFDFFMVESTAVKMYKDSDPRDCSSLVTSQQPLYIKKENSSEHWNKIGLTDKIPGVYFYCYVGPSITSQAILINVHPSKPWQFASVIRHETGHAVGLDHSCKLSGDSSSYVGCGKLDSDTHPYRKAVLYPELGENEIKEELRQNDLERSACIVRHN